MAASDKSLSQAEAKKVAIKSLDAISGDHQFVILDQKTITKDYGWVFFYDTDKAIESGDPGFSVPGMGPLVVLSKNGHTKFLSSSVPPQVAIATFEQELLAGLKAEEQNPITTERP